MILTFAIKNFSSWALQSWIISYVYETEKKLRLNISEIILRMNLLHLNSSESSHHINVTTRHITQFSLQILYASLKLFSEGIAIIFIIIFLFYLYPIPSLIILSILLLTTISYLAIVGNSLKAAGQKAAAANSSIINIMSNLISGIREIRVYGIENFFKNLMKQQSTKHKDAYYQYTTKQLIPRYMIETVLMTMLVSIAIFMFWFGYDQAAIISMIGVLAVAAIRMMPGIVILTNSINNIINAQVILNELHDLYKHISSSNPQLKPLEITKNNRSEFKDLEMKKVSYSYPESSKSVISELNFKIHKGESIGLVGKSGAGKTTLVNLILGFLEDYDGEILFNGGTMKKVSYGDWLQYLSYIPQDKFLINDSIKSNIALGIDQENINLNLLQDSISLANLDDLVSSLDDGEDFIIGENGNKLSGGQRQRICLARAFFISIEK